MATTNNNKPIDMKQMWQQCEPLPAAVITSALASTVTAADGSARYIFYSVGANFYRYDCYGNAWYRGQGPNITPTVRSTMSYSKREGHRGNCLAGTASGMTIAGVPNVSLNGYNIRITSGAGEGQERTINSTGETVIKDQGIVTTATALVLTDTTKRWEINQFIGASVRVVYGTGLSQVRKILYNDATNLYVSDANYQQLEAWNNTPFSAIAPYAVPVATAGLQANYYIETKTIGVSVAWTTVPDATSSYCIESGGIWLFSSVAVAPFSSLQFYDVLTDTWATKTPLGGLLTALIGTDFSITHSKDIGGNNITGTVSSGTSNTITVPAISGQYENYRLRVTNPATGFVQRRRIVGHTTTVIQVDKPFDTTPDNTYTFEILPNTDVIYLVGNGQSSLYTYLIEQDIWATGASIDGGQTRNMSVRYSGQEAIAISTGVRSTSGITVLNATPTVGGAGYAVGDLFNITTGGTVGKGRVEAISAGGVVTAVSLYSSGINYTPGAGKATTIISGAGNNALTVNITTVGTVARITTATNTNFYKGDSVTITGVSEGAWNTTYTILAIDSLTTFDIVITATGNAAASFSQSITLLVDSTKNYGNNELAGKLVILQVAGTSPTTQIRRITSNTATTITVPTITAGANGTSRFIVCEPQALGRDRQWKVLDKSGEGYATGGTPTTLVDSGRNWFVNQWAGYKFKVLSGAGYNFGEITITSNTATTLTYSAPGFTPDVNTRYVIMDTFGTATSGSTTTCVDTFKNWTVNQWAGKYVIYTSGTGQRVVQLIASNTANTLTFATGTAPDTTTTYTILALPPLGAGIELMHLFNTTTNKGRYLFVFRGGASNIANKYCIICDAWDFTYFVSPQTETITTGSYFAYDGVDRIYFSPGVATGLVQYVLYLNLLDGLVYGLGSVTNTQLAPVIGNRMEIVDAPSGVQYLYHLRNSGVEMYRCQVFF
jgi:hypothetical protein